MFSAYLESWKHHHHLRLEYFLFFFSFFFFLEYFHHPRKKHPLGSPSASHPSPDKLSCIPGSGESPPVDVRVSGTAHSVALHAPPRSFICDSQGLSMSQHVPAHHPFLRLTTFRCRDGPALQLKGTWGGLSGPPRHVAPSAQPLYHSPSLTLLPESLPEDDVFIRLLFSSSRDTSPMRPGRPRPHCCGLRLSAPAGVACAPLRHLPTRLPEGESRPTKKGPPVTPTGN